MNLSEVNWDINAAGTWPLPVKLGATLIVCAVVGLCGFYFFTVDQLDSLEGVRHKEQELKTLFESKTEKSRQPARLPKAT